MLIRSWNVLHGNTSPPRRRSYLEEMVRLATADRPDVLLLQELPVWSLGRLGTWSGMQPLGDVVRRPRLPFVARALTALHPGLLRSLLTGQAQAVLLAPGLEVVSRHVVVLDRRGLLNVGRGERRLCQIVRLPGLTVANVHAAQASARARRQLERAAAQLPDGPAVLGGDFNIAGADAALDGFSPPGPGIDHVLVRGAEPSPLRVWPDDRRRPDGMLLSDHAPVEVTL